MNSLPRVRDRGLLSFSLLCLYQFSRRLLRMMPRRRGHGSGTGRGTTERGRGGRTVPYTLRGGSGPSTNADFAPVPATTGQPSTSQQAQVVQVDLEDLMGRIRAIVREERAEHTGDTHDTGVQGDPPLLPLPPPSGQLPVAPSPGACPR